MTSGAREKVNQDRPTKAMGLMCQAHRNQIEGKNNNGDTRILSLYSLSWVRLDDQLGRYWACEKLGGSRRLNSEKPGPGIRVVIYTFFYTIYIYSSFNSKLQLFTYEINHFNMTFMQINANGSFKYFKHGWKWHI